MAQYEAVLAQDPDCADARMGVRYVDYLRRKGRTAGAFLGSHRPSFSERQIANKTLNDAEYAARRLSLESLPHRRYL